MSFSIAFWFFSIFTFISSISFIFASSSIFVLLIHWDRGPNKENFIKSTPQKPTSMIPPQLHGTSSTLKNSLAWRKASLLSTTASAKSVLLKVIPTGWWSNKLDAFITILLLRPSVTLCDNDCDKNMKIGLDSCFTSIVFDIILKHALKSITTSLPVVKSISFDCNTWLSKIICNLRFRKYVWFSSCRPRTDRTSMMILLLYRPCSFFIFTIFCNSCIFRNFEKAS